MPSIAWFPLAIVLFKLDEGAIYFVVVIGAAPSIANGVIAGVDHDPADATCAPGACSAPRGSPPTATSIAAGRAARRSSAG